MARTDVIEAIETGELIQQVDAERSLIRDGRAAGDLFKLTAPLRSLVDVRLTNLKARQNVAMLSEGGQAGASKRVRDGLDAAPLATTICCTRNSALSRVCWTPRFPPPTDWRNSSTSGSRAG